MPLILETGFRTLNRILWSREAKKGPKIHWSVRVYVCTRPAFRNHKSQSNEIRYMLGGVQEAFG